MDDIRWKQRFENFEKAFNNFKMTLNELKQNKDSFIYKMAVIKAYEMIFELSWKTMKDYLFYAAGIKLLFPRDILKDAFAYEIIDNWDIWIKMLDDRNLTVHTYNEDIADLVIEKIEQDYSPAITQIYNYLKGKING